MKLQMKKQWKKILAGVLSLFLLFQSTVYAENYEYDKLDRLIRVNYDNGVSITYTYDSNGNIIRIEKQGKENTGGSTGTGESGGTGTGESGGAVPGGGDDSGQEAGDGSSEQGAKKRLEQLWKEAREQIQQEIEKQMQEYPFLKSEKIRDMIVLVIEKRIGKETAEWMKGLWD